MKRIEPNPRAQPQTHASGILTGDDLFIAGQVGFDPKTGEILQGMSAQSKASLENLVSVVEAAGGCARDVAKLTIFVSDMEALSGSVADLQKAIFAAFGTDYLPAISLIGVTALLSPEFLIEIEGHAKIGGSSK